MATKKKITEKQAARENSARRGWADEVTACGHKHLATTVVALPGKACDWQTALGCRPTLIECYQYGRGLATAHLQTVELREEFKAGSRRTP